MQSQRATKKTAATAKKMRRATEVAREIWADLSDDPEALELVRSLARLLAARSRNRKL